MSAFSGVVRMNMDLPSYGCHVNVKANLIKPCRLEIPGGLRRSHLHLNVTIDRISSMFDKN
ncbi:hypothetical protein J6590_069448 [Homalodisca vitripennis]|nr:hypothetical protein J6590_069448 [Homalodisca vitripennis]